MVLFVEPRPIHLNSTELALPFNLFVFFFVVTFDPYKIKQTACGPH